MKLKYKDFKYYSCTGYNNKCIAETFVLGDHVSCYTGQYDQNGFYKIYPDGKTKGKYLAGKLKTPSHMLFGCCWGGDLNNNGYYYMPGAASYSACRGALLYHALNANPDYNGGAYNREDEYYGRHGGKVNMVFYDGHVSSTKSAKENNFLYSDANSGTSKLYGYSLKP